MSFHHTCSMISVLHIAHILHLPRALPTVLQMSLRIWCSNCWLKYIHFLSSKANFNPSLRPFKFSLFGPTRIICAATAITWSTRSPLYPTAAASWWLATTFCCSWISTTILFITSTISLELYFIFSHVSLCTTSLHALLFKFEDDCSLIFGYVMFGNLCFLKSWIVIIS